MAARQDWTRRGFLRAAGAAGTLAWAGCATTRSSAQRLEGVFPSYIDAKTGATVYNLTPQLGPAQIVYQTHPMWTPGMAHLVFTAGGQVQALEMATGTTRPVLEPAHPFSMQWRSSALYYLDGRELYRLDVPTAFRGEGAPVHLGSLPAEYLQSLGGLSVDAAGDAVYLGVLLEAEKRWGVAAWSPAGWRTVTEVDFKVGHVQACPDTPGAVLFCWETGGDAPQRTWFVDAASGTARPAYPEVDNEWVTHETWWGPHRILYTIWPYDDAHKALPHGVAWTDLRDGKRHVLAQYPAWHTHGSPDGRWALGDDFDRNLWLIDRTTLERRLLTQGHEGGGIKVHPHASFTPDSRAVVLNSSRPGVESIYLVPIPEFQSLPLAPAG